MKRKATPAGRAVPAGAAARAGGAAGKADAKSTVQSLAKGFKVLEAFTAQAPELTLAEVARRAGLDNATTFRLLNTLVGTSYVQRVPETRRFRLSLKVLDLGFHAIARMELRARVRPALRSLVGDVNEAASLAVLDGTEMLYVERVQAGLTRLGVDIRIGSRLPVYCSSLGLAMLAWMSPERRNRLLDAAPRVKLTANTVTDKKEILARLALARRQGYVVVDQEITLGLRVLAAPVLDVDRFPIAAVSVAAPVIRMPLAEFVKVAAGPVMEAAREIGEAMQAGGTMVAAGG
jgi:IclR family pca regulon transcriptional regulator